MPAVSGNKHTLAFGKQTGKGSPAATALYKLKPTAGDIDGVPQRFQLAESDSSRQGGKTVVVGHRVAGAPEFYLRPSDAGLLLYALFGAIVTSGAGADKTHDLTPADSGPYLTCWRALGGSIAVSKFSDIRVTGARIRGQAGQPIVGAFDMAGLKSVFGATDDVAAPVTETPFVYPEITVTKAGAAPGTIESFELNIANNGEFIQGDKQLEPHDYVWGELGVSGTMVVLFESDADYRAFQTGTAVGTGPSKTLYTETLSIKAERSATQSIEFIMNGISHAEYPLSGDPGGAPIRVAIGFRAEPQASIDSYIKAVVKNQVVSY